MSLRALVYQHFDFPSLGHLGEYLDTSDVMYECRIYSGINSEATCGPDYADLLILLGSPASVNDKVDWVSGARKLVKRHLDLGKPAFGICFGAQLIASALGGQVTKLDDPRIGFRNLGQAADDGFGGNWLCFHEEHISPSPELEPLMINSGTLYAYRHPHALGLQFHPEMDREVLERIIVELREDEALVGRLKQAVAGFDPTSRERSLDLFARSFAALLEGRTKP
jgi:GMP synthase (glutamine-hydrolysing)